MNRLSIIGALFATLASSACCIVPGLLAAIGISGVGVSAFLMDYRPLFLAMGGAFLITALAAAFYRARAVANAGPQAAGACCPPGGAAVAIDGGASTKTRVSGPSWFLWAIALTAVLLAGYPYFARAFLSPPPAPTPASAFVPAPAAAQQEQPMEQPQAGSCGQDPNASATPCACR